MDHHRFHLQAKGSCESFEAREKRGSVYVHQSKFGSPQESDEMPILGRFPKRDEFGLRRGDALRFEEQVA